MISPSKPKLTSTLSSTGMSSPGKVKGVVDWTFREIYDEASLSVLVNSMQITHPKEEITILKLSNNIISDVNSLINPLKENIKNDSILLVDLSFNRITGISNEFVDLFPNIKTLKLHANQIQKISDIKKLAKLKQLKSLSLYGNPIETHKHYKNYILYNNPGITQFDSSQVTKKDRENVQIWSRTYRKVLEKMEQ